MFYMSLLQQMKVNLWVNENCKAVLTYFVRGWAQTSFSGLVTPLESHLETHVYAYTLGGAGVHTQDGIGVATLWHR